MNHAALGLRGPVSEFGGASQDRWGSARWRPERHG
jgi:hypothetical protein